MRFAAPLFFAFMLFLFGRRLGGVPVGLLLALGGGVVAWTLGSVLRSRAVGKAPPAPAAEPGESPRLHGPVTVLQAQGPQACWAYLSDRRLNLLPTDGSQGVQLRLDQLTDIRPFKRRWTGAGEISLASASGTWRLKVPGQEQWLQALRTAARSADALS